MVTESTIYWITRMSYLQGFALIISISSLIGAVIYFGVSFVCRSEDYKDERHKWNKHHGIAGISIILSVILICGACLIPNTREMCAIKVIPVIVNNEEVQELPVKVIDLANEWIEAVKPTSNTE